MTFSLYGMKSREVLALFNTFPALYRHFISHDIVGSEVESAIGCGHGRFQLVYDLSRDIESAALQMGLDPRSAQWPLVVRISDVDGKLEFNVLTPETDEINLSPLYLTGAVRPVVDPVFRVLIASAERKSAQICDSCGDPGHFRTGHTQCDWCAEERLRMQSLDDEMKEP